MAPLDPRYYIAPTEPPELRSLGHTSLLPESMGCDVLYYSYRPTLCIGFQRKEIKDFIASLIDGRLTKELGQIASDNHLSRAILILEGRLIWTTDGKLANGTFTGSTFDKYTLRKLLINIQSSGIFICQTDDLPDTISTIQHISSYLAKPNHDSLLRRPKNSSKDGWGRTTNSSFASHILQGFPSIGPGTALEIYNRFGHIPLQWTCTEDELISIPGIGRKTAQKLMDTLK